MVNYAGSGKYIYLNGEFVPEAEAKVHVLSGAVKYGALVFEGLVAYLDGEGRDVNVFRLPGHVARLFHSMRLMRFQHDFTPEGLHEIVLETLRRNDVRQDVHIRLAAFVEGHGQTGEKGPVGVSCSVTSRPARSLEAKAIRCAVSSWRRIDDTTLPPRIKSAANYANGRLGVMQAREDGYDEAIFLTQAGKVAEAASSCFFAVRDGQLITSEATHGILESITRDSLIQLLARDCARPVVEREIDRSELYLCEEAFLCGSSYEVTPIVDIDGFVLGDGQAGPLTRLAWLSYEAALRGGDGAHAHWLTPVHGAGLPRRAAGSG